jgi:hypothetical protein
MSTLIHPKLTGRMMGTDKVDERIANLTILVDQRIKRDFDGNGR